MLLVGSGGWPRGTDWQLGHHLGNGSRLGCLLKGLLPFLVHQREPLPLAGLHSSTRPSSALRDESDLGMTAAGAHILGCRQGHRDKAAVLKETACA